LPQVDRSGHEMTGVGHDMVTLPLCPDIIFRLTYYVLHNILTI
jgi:hypothetical protein